MKLYFLTRSLYPYQKTGGAQIRNAQIDSLKSLGYEVIVVMPNYENSQIIIKEDEILIPFLDNLRFVTLLEIVGIYEDYLDKWVKNASDILKSIVKKDDILFATSGGELGMIKLSIIVKKEIGCKVVANFHDPLVYSIVHTHKLKYRFHVSREEVEKKYIKEIDFIITSSKSYKEALLKKYPFLVEKIVYIYFGYIKRVQTTVQKDKNDTLNIAYAGYMSAAQKPELMLEILKYNKNVKLFFIGDISGYEPLSNIYDNRVEFIDQLPHSEFLTFMNEKIDVGFVSLGEEYFGACVPSKIYEYINLELPIFGMLPKGDAQDMINTNGYGIAIDFDKTDTLKEVLGKLEDREILNNFRDNIIKDKSNWSFDEQFKKVDLYLKKLIQS
jgi:glycosyltransferase involved in cell wall biosynthesis